MAKYRALVSFTGSVSMAMGEVREISDTPFAESLVKVGYLMEVDPKKAPKAEPKEEPKEEPEKEPETVTEKKKSPKRKEK